MGGAGVRVEFECRGVLGGGRAEMFFIDAAQVGNKKNTSAACS